jgi:tetraacyldisaccharide-1-P 4'-kinase
MGNDVDLFRESVVNALVRFGKVPNSNRDVLVEGQHAFFFADWRENSWHIENVLLERVLGVLAHSTFYIVTGIARGERFVAEMLSIVASDSCAKHLELADHGLFTQGAADFLNDSRIVVLTAKDYFRWCDNEVFRNAVHGKKIIIVTVDVSCFFWGNQEERISWPKDDLL